MNVFSSFVFAPSQSQINFNRLPRLDTNTDHRTNSSIRLETMRTSTVYFFGFLGHRGIEPLGRSRRVVVGPTYIAVRLEGICLPALSYYQTILAQKAASLSPEDKNTRRSSSSRCLHIATVHLMWILLLHKTIAKIYSADGCS